MDTTCYAPIPVWKLDNDQKKEMNLLEALEEELSVCEKMALNEEEIKTFKTMQTAVKRLMKDLKQVNELFGQYAQEHTLPLNHLLVIDYRSLQNAFFELEFKVRQSVEKINSK